MAGEPPAAATLEASPAPPALLPPKPKVQVPVFLENPDGTITEAVPLNYKPPRLQRPGVQRGRRTPGSTDADSDGSTASSTAGPTMYQEIDFLYTRHERIFSVLLSMQFFLEVLYVVVFVIHMNPSADEFVAMYRWKDGKSRAELILWVVFALQVGYTSGYYALAGAATCTKRPKHYQSFAQWCLAGVVMLVLLAYIDKFNLPLFFLRLLAYIYARFLQGLTASLLLLPPPAQTATP